MRVIASPMPDTSNTPAEPLGEERGESWAWKKFSADKFIAEYHRRRSIKDAA